MCAAAGEPSPFPFLVLAMGRSVWREGGNDLINPGPGPVINYTHPRATFAALSPDVLTRYLAQSALVPAPARGSLREVRRHGDEIALLPQSVVLPGLRHAVMWTPPSCGYQGPHCVPTWVRPFHDIILFNSHDNLKSQ